MIEQTVTSTIDLPEIETSRLLLRKWRESDVSDMFEYASDPEVTRFALWPQITSMDAAHEEMRASIARYASEGWMYWGLEAKRTRKFIGAAGFTRWDRQNNCAELGYALNQNFWHQGLTTEACVSIIEFGWDRMKLHRIEAKCIEMNEASLRVLEKLGFTLEGVRQEAALVEGHYLDVGVYGLIRPR